MLRSALSWTSALPMKEVPPPWSVRPPPEWFQSPLGSRPDLGGALVERAITLYGSSALSQDGQNRLYSMDTWCGLFTVCYLNVGLRHLVGSQPEAVELVRTQRPDILFPGDLVATPSQVGFFTSRLHARKHPKHGTSLVFTIMLHALPTRRHELFGETLCKASSIRPDKAHNQL
jgi:hypothetical protein